MHCGVWVLAPFWKRNPKSDSGDVVIAMGRSVVEPNLAHACAAMSLNINLGPLRGKNGTPGRWHDDDAAGRNEMLGKMGSDARLVAVEAINVR